MPAHYERRLILSYLSNAVSRLRSGAEEARNLVQWLLKHEDQLKFRVPVALDDETEGAMRHRQHGKELSALEWQRLEGALKSELAASRQARPDLAARRIRRLARATGLTRTDTAILELLLRYYTGGMVESMIDDISDSTRWGRRSCKPRNPLLPCMLGLSTNKVWSRFAPDAPLLTSGLVSIDDDGDVTLIDRLTRLDWQPNGTGANVQDLLLDEASPGDLCWSDFDHVADERDHVERILRGALQTGARGVNVLVYGPPGTGKTEFCKALAARLEASLYVVGEQDGNGREPSRHERLQELRLAQRLLAENHRSILLFDEMEDLLSSQGTLVAALFGSRGFAGLPAEGSKVFMNRLLEETPVPVLWTSNAALQTSPVLLRRMMFALELGQPPPKVRARIWARHLAHHGIESAEEDANALAREFEVTPGVASGVTAAARLGGGTMTEVRRGVRALAQVMSGRKAPPQPTPQSFDPALICADVDPVQLADRLAGTGARHFSLCLQGPPGTGKSAFVRHLAERLGLEVMQKRASDLMAMYVGETEKQIAKAFAEARDAEAFLVFDEADSLPRRPSPRATKLGSQPGQRDADVDGEPPAPLRLHHQLRRPPRLGQRAALHVQDRPRLPLSRTGRGRVPPLLRHRTPVRGGQPCHPDAGRFRSRAPKGGDSRVPGRTSGTGRNAGSGM